jgi:hypothetical protein
MSSAAVEVGGRFQRGEPPKSYYAYKEGGFGDRDLAPNSHFYFEELVASGESNRVTLDYFQGFYCPWPVRYLPSAITGRLPECLGGVPKWHELQVSTKSCEISNPPTTR